MLPRSQRLTLFRPPERIEETAMPAYEEPIAAVTLWRGPCFGSWPVYEVTLAAPAQRCGAANGSWTGPATMRARWTRPVPPTRRRLKLGIEDDREPGHLVGRPVVGGLDGGPGTAVSTTAQDPDAPAGHR